MSPNPDAALAAGTRPRLRPREHGAYAMPAFPLCSGLIHGGLSWAGAAFASWSWPASWPTNPSSSSRAGRGERIRAGGQEVARIRLQRLAGLMVAADVATLTLVAVRVATWGPA